MITSLSWLKNHLATKANLNQVAEPVDRNWVGSRKYKIIK